MEDLFDNVWGGQSEIVVDHCVDITLPVRYVCDLSSMPCLIPTPLQIALFVIGVAGSLCPISIVPDSYERILGFGRRLTWTSDLVIPPGHQMTFKDALHILSANLMMKLSLPGWTKNLTKHNRKVQQSFVELKVGFFNA